MADDAGSAYVVTRHAPVVGHDPILWVTSARWDHPDGTAQWCLESWEYRGEAGEFDVEDEAAALRLAREKFGVDESDWRLGPQPRGRPE